MWKKYKQTNKSIWQPHQSLVKINQEEKLQIDDVFFKTQKWMEIFTGTPAGYSSSCPHILPVSSALREGLLRLLRYMSFCCFPLYTPPSPYTWFRQLHAKCSHQTLLLQPSSSQSPQQGELGTKQRCLPDTPFCPSVQKVTPAWDNLLHNTQDHLTGGQRRWVLWPRIKQSFSKEQPLNFHHILGFSFCHNTFSISSKSCQSLH